MKTTKIFTLATCALALAGCGGTNSGGSLDAGNGGTGGSGSDTGGSGGGTTTTNNTGQNEAVASARGAAAFGLNGSTASFGRSTERGNKLTGLAMKMADHTLTATRGTGYTYDASFGLYYTVTQPNQNTLDVYFYTDPNGRQSAGTIVMNAYSSNGNYPVTINETINITAGVSPMNGNESWVFADSSLANYRLSGNLRNSAASLTFNLSYTASSVSGSLSAQSNGSSVSYSNLYVTSSSYSSDFVCNGISGHINVYSDNSGSLTWQGNGGQYRLDWDSAGNAVVTYPNGQSQAVGNIYSN